MNSIRLLITAALILAPSLLAQDKVDRLAWLAGHWSGAAGKALTEEHWISPAGGAMLGLSRTIARQRMASFEFLRIEERTDGVYYVAQPQGRPPVDFKLTRSGPKLAVFENPAHDHPKIISYELTGPGALLATIEGDEKGKHIKMSFPMKQVNR